MVLISLNRNPLIPGAHGSLQNVEVGFDVLQEKDKNMQTACNTPPDFLPQNFVRCLLSSQIMMMVKIHKIIYPSGALMKRG